LTASKSITDFLARAGVEYSIVGHPHSESSDTTAEAAHVSGEKLAKGILLKDNRGYVLAVIPASHAMETGTLGQKIRRPLVMASETEIARVFADCEVGAIPVLGKAYGLTTVVDHALCSLEEIYFEAGDHEALIKIAGEDFQRFMGESTFASFSHHNG
jgi:Ala-tRNA(Pro) deacylase